MEFQFKANVKFEKNNLPVPNKNASNSEIIDYVLDFKGYEYVEYLINNDRLPKTIPQHIAETKSIVLITSYLGEAEIFRAVDTDVLDCPYEYLRTYLFMMQRSARYNECLDETIPEMKDFIDYFLR